MKDWILLSETTLPEFEVPILVATEGRVAIARLIGITIRQESQNRYVSLEFHIGDSGLECLWISPTHWMRLPDFPQNTT